MLQTFFTRRALEMKLGTLRALQGHLGNRTFGHSRLLGTWALKAPGHSKKHLGTRAFKPLGNLGTEALRRSKDTRALEVLYLADSKIFVQNVSNFIGLVLTSFIPERSNTVKKFENLLSVLPKENDIVRKESEVWCGFLFHSKSQVSCLLLSFCLFLVKLKVAPD